MREKIEALLSRRSIRQYKDEQISEEQLQLILDTLLSFFHLPLCHFFTHFLMNF